MVKRDKWTEAEIEALPAGEHDYFDRKGGRVFEKTDHVLSVIAKAVCAFANSGGGHIVLGVDDSGVPDGVPRTIGHTPVREWLEQKVPHLLEYPLSDFRVHAVIRGVPSRIPVDREVIVIDVGDSALAPHQCGYGGGDAKRYVYYYRQAGHSVPAPHFYLELLRQRLVNPVLEAKLVAIRPRGAKAVENGIFLACLLRFSVENVGRVAAYKWQLQVREMGGYSEERLSDYRFGLADFPPGMQGRDGSIRMDDTILPGCSLYEERDFGILLRVLPGRTDQIRDEIERLLCPVTLGYRVATETSPGELNEAPLRQVLRVDDLASFICQYTEQTQ